jgi:hypothetical protein
MRQRSVREATRFAVTAYAVDEEAHDVVVSFLCFLGFPA